MDVESLAIASVAVARHHAQNHLSKKDFVDVFSDFTAEPMLLAKSAHAASLAESIFNSYKQK